MIRVFSRRRATRPYIHIAQIAHHKRQNRGLAHKLKFTNALYESCVIKFNDLWTFIRTPYLCVVLVQREIIACRFLCDQVWEVNAITECCFLFISARFCSQCMRFWTHHKFISTCILCIKILNLYLLPFHFQECICWKALELLIVCLFFTHVHWDGFLCRWTKHNKGCFQQTTCKFKHWIKYKSIHCKLTFFNENWSCSVRIKWSTKDYIHRASRQNID